MRYESFKMIEDSSNLAEFLNSVMRRLQTIRMLVAPTSFERDDDISSFQDEKFCDFCRYECWMHAVVDKLRFWEKTISEYFTEFDGSWEYYAMSRMRESEEDSDNEAEYRYYSIVGDLCQDGWKDIVSETSASSIKGLCGDLIANSHIDILDGIKKHFGCDVQSFKMDGDVLRPMSQEEHELDMAVEQADAEDDSKRIFGIVGSILAILEVLRKCKYDDDNTELLQMALTMSQGLLNLDFETVHDNVRKFHEKYAEDEE